MTKGPRAAAYMRRSVKIGVEEIVRCLCAPQLRREVSARGCLLGRRAEDAGSGGGGQASLARG